MKKLLLATISAAAVFAGSAFAEEEAAPIEMTMEGAKAALTEIPAVANCTAPSSEMPTDVPAGATSSEAEMMEYIGRFKAYDAEAGEYMTCLDNVKVNLGDGATPTQLKAITMVQNSVSPEEIGAKLNEEIQAFNAANPD